MLRGYVLGLYHSTVRFHPICAICVICGSFPLPFASLRLCVSYAPIRTTMDG